MAAVNDLLAEGGCADILFFDFCTTLQFISRISILVPHHSLLVNNNNNK